MAAAALRPMMAVAREEAAIISSDVAMAARSTVGVEAGAAVRGAAHEAFNPLAIREAAEATAQRAVQRSEGGVFGALSHANTAGTPTLTTSTSTVTSSVLGEAGAEVAQVSTQVSKLETTAVGQLIEKDAGSTVAEAITNATETGAQEVAEQLNEVARAVLDGKFTDTRQAAAAVRAAAA